MECSNYTVTKLKEILRRLKLKTSGSKQELLVRLAKVEADLVEKVCAEIDGENHDLIEIGDGGSESSVVDELREMVEQLSAEVKVLREAAAISVSNTSTSCVSTVPLVADMSALPDRHGVVYSSQPVAVSTDQRYIPINTTQGYAHSVYTSQPMIMTTGHQFTPMLPGLPNMANVSQPVQMTVSQPTWTTSGPQNFADLSQHGGMRAQNRGPYVPNSYRSAQVQQTPTSMQTATQQHTLRDVTAIIPVFDPVDETYTSTQFVERIEQLRIAYAWDDAVLIFAVLSKLKGVAKRWADAQPVFHTWESFVVAFLNDFPYVSNAANAHIALMNARINKGEKLVEYYYRMLALGRRENIDDMAIIKYIINGLYDDNVKRTLSAMHFQQCSELLRSMQNLSEMSYHRQVSQKRVFEMYKEPKVRNEENNFPAKKVEATRFNNNNNSHGVVCFKCRQRGHIAKNCQQRRRFNNNNEAVNNLVSSEVVDEHENVAEINSVNFRKKHELTKSVTICAAETIVCIALIDSGSGRSLVKKSVADKCKSEKVECYEKLVGFAGREILCNEKICVPIKIDNVERKSELLIVDDKVMSYDVLVGLDILEKATVIIENGTCKMMTIQHTEIDMGENLEKHIIKKFEEVVDRYEVCFGEELHELGKSKRFKMSISLTSNVPVCKKPYNIPIPKRKVVEEIVRKLLELNIIRPSMSIYASPIVLVRKHNGEDRMCVDYRQLNAITEKQPWSMPTVDGVLSSLSGHSFFTTLDFMSGYYQIEMEEDSKHLTAFVTHQGQYEFNRMPFGLRNAPCTFQRAMTKLIEPMGNKVISYVDEIVIGTKTAEENIHVLEEFLSLVRREGLTLRISKCSFLKSAVNFLGHVVNANGIQPGPEKVMDVEKFPVPSNQHELRRFLGLTGFFRKFVANYAQKAKPLTNLMKKDVQFLWSSECQEAFEALIQALTSSPVLAIYDVNKEHQLHTDASSIGLAAILVQQNEDKNWQAVAYFSRCCNKAEQKYHAYELEVLAVVEGCERFKMYLMGKNFTVVTDCQSISTAKLSKPMVPRVARWLLKLQEYDYQLVHRAGESMKHVDALSRAPRSDAMEENDENKVNVIETHDWVSLMQQCDEKLKYIMGVLRGDHESDQKKQFMKQYIMKNHRLFYKTSDSTIALVVPKGMRWRIVKLYHDDIGHPAVEAVLQRMHSNFWFPRMRNYVKSYIKSCIDCAYYKEAGRKGCVLYGMEVPSLPFQVLHLDHLGPFVRSKRGFEYILVCVDALTQYIMIYPTRTTSTKPVIEALNQLTLYFGLPKTMVTDRGSAFTSSAFEKYCEENHIQHIKVAVRTPRSNGLAERANQKILTYLKTTTANPRDWDIHVRLLQWTLNTKQNATTKFAPMDLIFDFPMRDISGNKLVAALEDDMDVQLNTKREEAAKNIEEAGAKWKKRFDAKHTKPFVYKEGDLVLIESPIPSTGESRKLQPKYKGPYVVVKVLRYDRYVVEDSLGNQRTKRKYSAVMAADKMKPWCSLFPELDAETDDQQEVDDED